MEGDTVWTGPSRLWSVRFCLRLWLSVSLTHILMVCVNRLGAFKFVLSLFFIQFHPQWSSCIGLSGCFVLQDQRQRGTWTRSCVRFLAGHQGPFHFRPILRRWRGCPSSLVPKARWGWCRRASAFARRRCRCIWCGPGLWRRLQFVGHSAFKNHWCSL